MKAHANVFLPSLLWELSLVFCFIFIFFPVAAFPVQFFVHSCENGPPPRLPDVSKPSPNGLSFWNSQFPSMNPEINLAKHTRCEDEVAEWLRRWTANPLCSACVGSNPTFVDLAFLVRGREDHLPRSKLWIHLGESCSYFPTHNCYSGMCGFSWFRLIADLATVIWWSSFREVVEEVSERQSW